MKRLLLVLLLAICSISFAQYNIEDNQIQEDTSYIKMSKTDSIIVAKCQDEIDHIKQDLWMDFTVAGIMQGFSLTYFLTEDRLQSYNNQVGFTGLTGISLIFTGSGLRKLHKIRQNKKQIKQTAKSILKKQNKWSIDYEQIIYSINPDMRGLYCFSDSIR